METKRYEDYLKQNVTLPDFAVKFWPSVHGDDLLVVEASTSKDKARCSFLVATEDVATFTDVGACALMDKLLDSLNV